MFHSRVRVAAPVLAALCLMLAPRPAPAVEQVYNTTSKGTVETVDGGLKLSISATGTMSIDETAGTMTFTANLKTPLGDLPFTGTGLAAITAKGRIFALLDIGGTGTSGKGVVEGTATKNRKKFTAKLSAAVPGATPGEFIFSKMTVKGTLQP